YYKQALDYFRKAREKRDAVSLYTSIGDDLKTQTVPTQKPTSFDQWSRTVYHGEDPLKLYNAKESPSWYIDDRESNCLLPLGFCCFLNGRYDEAKIQWMLLEELSPELRRIKLRNIPNLLSRLDGAVRQKFLLAPPEELKGLPDKGKVRLLLAEFNFINERFQDALELYRAIQSESAGGSPQLHAAALTGEADTLRMIEGSSRNRIISLYRRVLDDRMLKDDPVLPRTLFSYACTLHQSADAGQNKEGVNLLEECGRRFPKSRYGKAALFQLAAMTRKSNPAASQRYLAQFRKNCAGEPELELLEGILNVSTESSAR
ncbi:MAG: hypothetical protein HP058_03150, partial [Massilimaliae sp.]|nr:hypothetical protein [Massiliimalia sp.]